MGTIETTVKKDLCISCGICVGNCPCNCIHMQLSNYQYKPVIDSSRCITCGKCLSICPVNQIADYNESIPISDFLLGEYRDILCAQAKDTNILKSSTSGGFITQTVKSLLSIGLYQSAFLVKGYNYSHQLYTERFAAGDDLDQTSKSRYLMISHENTVRYILSHPEKRVIIVATPCVMQGIVNVIYEHKLCRENYLLLGLFCDKTMTQGVVEFFKQHKCGKGRKLKNLYFRTKDAGGWPGNVRLEYEDGSIEDLPNTERIKVKDYFMPSHCAICLDKLNRLSDISVGDNYISENKDSSGANSIIIRTENGKKVWNEYLSSSFLFHKDDLQAFIESQKLESKGRNYLNGRIRGLFHGKELEEDKAYKLMMEKIKIGQSENVYSAVNSHIRKQSFRNKAKKILQKFLSLIRRV